MSGSGITVVSMQSYYQIRQAIELDLAEVLELGLDAEEALVETAGLLADAEARFVRLSQPVSSRPPPPRP